MPTVRSVQRQISRLEGFDVHFLYEGPGPRTGPDVRDDRDGLPSYPYRRAAPDSTITVWIERRFKSTFPGFDVAVLLGNGDVADHRTLLSTVRDTYQ